MYNGQGTFLVHNSNWMNAETHTHTTTYKHTEMYYAHTSWRIKQENKKDSTTHIFILQKRHAETSITIFSKINCIPQLKEKKMKSLAA